MKENEQAIFYFFFFIIGIGFIFEDTTMTLRHLKYHNR